MPRETTSAATGSWRMRARWSSKSMAAWTWGSPTAYANANASRPAARPASMPRTSRARTMTSPLVAGEAEEVATVVHELVDEGAGEDRRGALLGADEVQQHDREHAREEDV